MGHIEDILGYDGNMIIPTNQPDISLTIINHY